MVGFRLDLLTEVMFEEVDNRGDADDNKLALPKGLSKASVKEYAATLMAAAGYSAEESARWLAGGPGAGPLPFEHLGAQDVLGEAGWKRRIESGLKDGDTPMVLVAAVSLLVMLWVRWRRTTEAGGPFATFFALGGRWRVSVATLLLELDRCADLPLVRFAAFVMEEWVLGQHLRVSLRKLRNEGIDTFWIRAGETSYELHPKREAGNARPLYNGYKVGAAMSCLYDVGLLDKDGDGRYVCSDEGRAIRDRVIAMGTGR